MLTAEQRKELCELTLSHWEEEEEVANALFNFLNDVDLCKSVIEKERIFNRYTYCNSWYMLAIEIIDDEAIEGDEVDHLCQIIEDWDAVREFLLDNGWCLDFKNEVAIGFDDDVTIFQQEVR